MAKAADIATKFTAVDKFSDVVSKMGGNVSKFSNTSAAAIDRFNAKANKMAGQMAIAGGAIVGGLGLAVNAASDFEKSMSNVATLLDTNVEDMDAMGKEVLDMAKVLPVPIEELTGSLYDIRSAGIAAENAMGALNTSARLSKAGLSTTTEATNILTSAMNAFASEGKSSDEIANVLFKTVKAGKTNMSQLAQAFGATAPIIQSAGVQLDDFSAATAALTTVGTPASQAQNQIRAAVVALQKPTADMEKIFKRLGVTSEKDLIAREGSLVGAFEAVNKAGSDMGINLAKAWSSTEAGAAVTSLLGATNEAYIGTLKDMRSGTDALSEAFEKQLNTTASRTQIAKNNMEALSITIGTQVAPMLTELLSVVTPIIGKFADFIGRNQWLAKTLAVVGVGLLAASVAIKAVTMATAAWNAVMALNPISAIIIGVAALIALVVAAIAYWDDWGAAVMVFLGPIGMVISFVKALYDNWEKVKEAFSSGGILSGLMMIGRVFISSVLQPFEQLLKLASNIPGMSWAGEAADSIAAFRADMLGNEQPQASNPRATEQEAMRENFVMQTNNANVNLNVNDPTGRTSASSDNDFVKINMGSTFAFG